MAEPARATVVIVNWNGERLLRSCLDALARQQADFAYETWVVDNASTDGSVALLEREYPDVRVLRNGANLGFAGGNNTALRQIRTPYAVLLNNDATPEPDWLGQLLAPFDVPGNERLAAVTSKVVFEPTFLRLSLATPGFFPGGGDPRELGVRLFEVCVEDVRCVDRVLMEKLTWGPEGVGAGRFRWTRTSGELLVPLPAGHPGPYEVTLRMAAETTKPVTVSWEGGSAELTATTDPTDVVFEVPAGVPTVDVVNNVGSIVTKAGYGADRGYQDVDDGRYDEPTDVFALCGCAVAFRTDAGRAVDWFDDDFFLYYEDTDLSWRLRAAGWSIRYEPKAAVRHVHSASAVEWSPTFTFHTTRNRLLMLVKNAGAQQARHEYVSFLADTAQMVLRVLSQLLHARRPAARPLLFRLKVLRSLVRLTPVMLRRRRAVARTSTRTRAELEEWLVVGR
ncbi:MAG: glycosyltransferase [Mycobacteriales bacterium]